MASSSGAATGAGTPSSSANGVGIFPAMRRVLWGPTNGPAEEPVVDGKGTGTRISRNAEEDNERETARKSSAGPAPSETDRPELASKTPTLVNSSMKNKRKKRSSSELERQQDQQQGQDQEGPASKRIKTTDWRATPSLSEHEQSSSDEAEAEAKGSSPTTSTEHRLATNDPQYRSDFLRRIPPEVVGLCLSFLCSTSERHSLQTTCRLFRRLSDSPDTMLSKLALAGDAETGRGGLITDADNPDSAVAKLVVFARSGNLEAIYMLGIIRCYCYDGAHHGIGLLRYAAERGHRRSSYALGLVLRDSYRDESKRWLTKAAKAGHMPAWQEILSAPEMKSRWGEPDADTLKSYLDSASLNRLLNRHYLKTKSVRTVHTSHCWNPLCGRWAYKATNQTTRDMRERESRNPVPIFVDYLPDLGCCSGCGTADASGGGGDNGAASPPTASDSAGRTGGEVAAAAAPKAGLPHSQPGGAAPVSNGQSPDWYLRVSRMKMCSSCRRAKYCSKLCQVYDWRSGRHKMECQFL